MPDFAALRDALIAAAAGVILAYVAMRMRPDFRGAMINMVLVILVGVIGIAVLYRFGGALQGHTAALVLREGFLLIVTIGFSRILIVFLVQGLFASMAIPRILGDVFMALSLVAFGIYRMNANDVNLASIITTSAVITTVLAFSLKEPLENLWAGISLQVDNTCRIGDWVQVEGVAGQVVGIRWRYTSLATNANETLIIPNSALVRNRVNILGRRGDIRVPWRRAIEFNVAYESPPETVIAAVESALLRAEIECVAKSPAPRCICASFAPSSIRYVLHYWLMDLTRDAPTDSRVRVHLFAALARNQMEIPIPRRRIFTSPEGSDETQRRVAETRAECVRALKAVHLFDALTEEEQDKLAADLRRTPFVDNDVITRQGETAESLYILAHGKVDILNDPPGGDVEARQKLATVSAPAYVGEMGLLTGQPRGATVIARGPVLAYRIEKPAFETILKHRPEIAEVLSRTLVERQTENDATLTSLSAEARQRSTGSRTGELVRRIRTFFSLDA